MRNRARRKIDAALKAKIALEALREQASVNETLFRLIELPQSVKRAVLASA